MPSYDDNLMELVFTLVHGTFARKAQWTQPQSEFCRNLVEWLKPHDVFIEPFDWSGRNSASARQRAAEELTSHLNEQRRKRPEACQIVIGHSHGGAVAVTTLASNRNMGISGVVCLSTPFIHVRHRVVFDRQAGVSFYGITTLLCAILTWFVTDDPGLRLVGIALCAPVVGRIITFVAQFVVDDAIDAQAGRLEMPRADGLQIVIFRVAADEASGWLGVARLATWFAGKWQSVVVGGADLMSVILSIVGCAGAAIVGVIIATGWSIVTNDEINSRFGPIVVSAMALALWFPVLASLMASLLLIPTMLLSTIAFGTDSWLAVLGADISTEETPKGDWRVHQLSFGRPVGGRTFLEHSSICADVRVFPLLSVWVDTIANGRRPASQSTTD